MKKFLFYLSIIASFFVMLSGIVPSISSWWNDYKQKKEEFDTARKASEGTVDMEEDYDGTFKAKEGHRF